MPTPPTSAANDRRSASTSSPANTPSSPSCSATPRMPRAWPKTLLAKGVYVIGFSYPVVPHGKARIRVQISAAHTPEELEFAVAQFAQAKSQLAL